MTVIIIVNKWSKWISEGDTSYLKTKEFIDGFISPTLGTGDTATKAKIILTFIESPLLEGRKTMIKSHR